METRRRSRSNTPNLRSHCDHENCDYIGDGPHPLHHKKKHSPNVKTIVEETVEVTSSSSVLAPADDAPSKMTQSKIKTSEDNAEKKSKTTMSFQTQQQEQREERTRESKTTTVITVGRAGNIATSTPKGSNFVTSFASQFASMGNKSERGDSSKSISQAHQLDERTQNLLNSASERSNNRDHLSGFLTSSFGNESSDKSNHIAYLEYKNAGEYWKTSPKTDYTYSKFSEHRRELAPGIVAMPNMSRKSLENHSDRVNSIIERNPMEEEYIRRRYESSRYTQNRKTADNFAYDSGDEVDTTYRNSANLYNMQQQQESWLMRFITTIVTTVTTTWSSITGSNSDKNGVHMYDSSMYYTHISDEKRGFFGSVAHGISSAFGYVFRSLYLFISSVLYVDTWLLQSSKAENTGKKRFLWLLFLLLPFLLLAAWWLLDEQNRLWYIQRWQSLVPLSLATTLRSSLSTNVHWLRSILQSPLFASSGTSSSSQQLNNIKISMQKSMGPEEYENILNHINSYVQTLVDLKLKEQQQKQQSKGAELSSNQIQLIVQIIKENFETIASEKRFAETQRQLSDSDLNIIIQKVVMKLQESESFQLPVTLSPQNIEEIKKLISQSIEINNHSYYHTIVENLDLEAFIGKLLKAPLFSVYINDEISHQLNEKLHEKLLLLQQPQSPLGSDHFAFLEQQKFIIDNLSQEISFIKLSLKDKLTENEDLHYSVKHLKQTQDDLIRRMQELEFSTDQRFSELMIEISNKLNSLREEQFQMLNQQVKLSLIEILGFRSASTAGGVNIDDMDLQNWVRNMFVAKDYLEERLADINNRTNERIKQDIDRSGMFLMRDISEKLKNEILLIVERKHTESNALLKGHIKQALSEEEVKNIVKSVLAIYDADKTGLVDFALESAGGQILSTRCTESYQTKTAQISVFGIPLWYPTNTPRVAISPNVQPGECWAFQGFPGFLVLKLNSLVYVTGFTLEHIPKTLSPDGRIDSAPRNFTVWGLEHEKDQEPILFGEYEYVDNDASLQYFPMKNKSINRPYEIVELRIESNHGQPLYTCLYRFRVHGKPPTL